MKHLVLAILMSSFTISCLQTRDSLKKDDDKDTQAKKLQQKNAMNESRFFEIDRDFRQLYGRVEVLEHKVTDGLKDKKEDYDSRLEKIERKLKFLEEAIIQLDAKSSKKTSSKKSKSSGPPKGNFASGEYYYGKKKWESAIYSYEKYRSANPKGKSYANVTYKIGVSFMKLGMKNDAKVFFEEVVQKYPKTKAAGWSKSKLKSL